MRTYTHDAALFNAILNNGAVLKLNRQEEIVTHTKSELGGFLQKIRADEPELQFRSTRCCPQMNVWLWPELILNFLNSFSKIM